MSIFRAGPVDRRARVLGMLVDDYPEIPPEVARGCVRRITVVGEEILRRTCQPVTEFGTPELTQLIDDMFVTMKIAEGAGLAANQVGVDQSLFVYDCFDGDDLRHVGHIINPVLETTEPRQRKLIDTDEGCLSVPGPRHNLFREERARVRGFDKDGKPLEIEGTGYFARCLQHETDHLNGVLYIDRLTSKQRRAVLAEMSETMDGVFGERRTRIQAMGAREMSAAE